MDIVDSATRSRMMSGIRSKNTSPELAVRRFLHARGFRYRLHVRTLSGRPDIVLAKYRVAIFVHGCFWHQHRGCSKATTPSTNVHLWAEKFRANEARDSRNVTALLDSGWHVIIVWECGLGRRSRDDAVLEWLVDAVRRPRAPVVEWPLVTPHSPECPA